VDPFDRRLTLNDWLVTTGFLASSTRPWTGPGSAIPDVSSPAGDGNILVDEANGGSAKATYVNGADLGFGRRMYLRTNPGVCLVCHGGKPQALVNGVYPNKGDTGAYFLPWDVGTFIFDAEAGFTKADQEKNFRELNRAVASHHQQGAKSDPVSGLTRRVAPVELIRGWYGGATLPNDTFDESFVPVGWRPSVERGIPVGARKIYREVIGPTCRACHAQRESALDFATFKGFDVHRASSLNLTYTVPHALANGAVDDSPARPGDDRYRPEYRFVADLMGNHTFAVTPAAGGSFEYLTPAGGARGPSSRRGTSSSAASCRPPASTTARSGRGWAPSNSADA
jgi:mono/diheme cytochrome c family protein